MSNVLRPIFMAERWSHCPFCTSSKVTDNNEGPDWSCRDCGHSWCDDYDHYRHEPESNPDR